MANILSVVSILLLAGFSAFSQDYYEECISLQGYRADNDVKVNASGEILLAGTNSSTHEGAVIKMDKYGNKIWAKDLGGYVGKFWLDNSGNVYASTTEYSPELKYKFHKYHSNGTRAWDPIVFDTEAQISDFKVDAVGNIFFVGTITNPLSENEFFPDYDLYVLKYNTAGAMIWQRKFADKVYQYSSTHIEVDNSGDVFIATELADDLTSEFLKINSNGQLGWKRYVYPPEGYWNDLYLDNSGNLFTLFLPTYESTSNFYKIDKNSGAFSFKSIPFKYPALNITNDRIYFIGAVASGMKILALDSDLTTVLNQDLDGDGDGNSATSLLIGPDQSFYSLSDFYDQTDGSITWRILKYSGGEIVSQFSRPFSGGASLVYDFERNFLMTDGSCLVKIYECEGSSVAITKQPANTEACHGTTAGLQVSATGKALKFQWYKGTNYLDDAGAITGTRTNQLTFKQVSIADAGTYYCVVKDGCGHLVQTQTVTLSVALPSTISANPQSISQCSGTDAVFQITTTGGKNVKYQWKKGSTALTESALLNGTRTNRLTIKSVSTLDAGEYFCEVTDDCSFPLVSQKATLGVQSATAISKNPENLVSCTGGSVTFSVNASGSELSYQWKKGGIDINESSRISGTKTSTLTLSLLDVVDTGDYTCVVSGVCGGSVTSSIGTLSVNSQQQITGHPLSKTICSSSPVSFSVTVSGTGATYQWMKGNSILTNNSTYSGVEGPALTIASASVAEQGIYTCVITTSCGNQTTSNAAQLTVGTPATVLEKSSDLNLCSGELANFLITTSGDAQSYQWRKDGIPLSDNFTTTGTKTNALFLSDVTALEAGNYTCEVVSSCGPPVTSGVIKLAVKEHVILTKQPVSQNLCESEVLILEVNAQGYSPSFQWKLNGANLTDTDVITGTKTDRLSLKNLTINKEGYYTCEVKGCAGFVSSKAALVTINPKPELIPVESIDCENFSFTWSSVVTDTRNTIGEYFLFPEGSTDPVTLSSIASTGNYHIVKQTQFCADTLFWNNTCIITGTGIEENQLDFSVSPNPTNRWIKIQYDPEHAKDFEIYDTRGIRIANGAAHGRETLLDGELWSNGMYLVRLRDSKGKVSFQRFIFQR